MLQYFRNSITNTANNVPNTYCISSVILMYCKGIVEHPCNAALKPPNPQLYYMGSLAQCV